MSMTDSAKTDFLDYQLELHKLINTCHWRADHFDWERSSQTFTEDAVLDLPNSFGLLTGRKETHDVCKGNMDHIYDMVNLYFEITGPDSGTEQRI